MMETATTAVVVAEQEVPAFDPRYCGCGAKIVRHGRGVGRCGTLGPETGVSDGNSRWSRPRSSWVCVGGARADRKRWPDGTVLPNPPAGLVEETRADRAALRAHAAERRGLPAWVTR